MAAAFPEPKFADTNGIRITGEVQSLYDGTISPLDEIVDAVFNINISIRADGNLAIVLSQ